MTNVPHKHITEANQILIALGLPRAQQNTRSALCLLALLNLTPRKQWDRVEDPLMGITPIMDWARKHYQKEYAPNTRETFRRQTMHQFVDAGIAVYNPDAPLLADLGVNLYSHGKMPDVVLYYADRHWLVLVEAVTSHGPVDGKRHTELTRLFIGAKAGLVYVTAFPNRAVMARYLGEIAWETEVWVADAPSHLIHFDGERFLGPYDVL